MAGHPFEFYRPLAYKPGMVLGYRCADCGKEFYTDIIAAKDCVYCTPAIERLGRRASLVPRPPTDFSKLRRTKVIDTLAEPNSIQLDLQPHKSSVE